jgi:hypothetical protein
MTDGELQKLSCQGNIRAELCVSNLIEVVQDMGYPILIGISLQSQASKTDGLHPFLRLDLRLNKLQDLN